MTEVRRYLFNYRMFEILVVVFISARVRVSYDISTFLLAGMQEWIIQDVGRQEWDCSLNSRRVIFQIHFSMSTIDFANKNR